MKNYFILFISLISISFVQAQILTINDAIDPESSFGPEQLISDVLVSGGCAGADNFTFQVSGAPADLQNKSYGYFRRTAIADFPFEQGIVLTTGIAFGGGNTAAFPANPNPDNNNGLPGDADLEAALGQTSTNDATFIKFNFVPTSDNISFRFIMASEEYDMNTECDFADSFAFLLREVGTTPYTNLAILPDGTPVSVTNINNSPACNSNPTFFEGYNLPDTNYGGRTVVLTASANVIANTTYEIKLVVADQGDSNWDSAIFIEAGSFNLGGDLGPDVTIATGTAKCIGESLTLNTQTDPTVAHTWFFNGAEIAGETGPTIDVTQAGTYSVNVTFGTTCVTMDTIEVEFIQPGIANNVNNLVECNNDGGTVFFDLTENTPEVLGTQNPADFDVSYYTSQADADMNTDAIVDTTMYDGADGEIIYVRIEDVLSGNCFATQMFTLQFLNIALNASTNIETCDDISNDGFEAFNLELQTPTVLGTQIAADFTVTYYTDFANADANTNALTSPYTNIINPQPIFVRIQSNQDPACYIASVAEAFNLIVNSAPVFPTNIPDYSICDDALDGSDINGFTAFDLTTQGTNIINGQNNVVISYHTSALDAMSNLDPILNLANYTNTDANTQIIHVRLENTITNCFSVSTFNIVVNELPEVQNATLVQCDEDGTPDGFTAYNLNEANENVMVNGDTTGFNYTHHLTLADAQDAINIVNPFPFTNTVNPQIIYVRIENITTGCFRTAEYVLDVTATDVGDAGLNQCDDDYDGFTEFTLSDADATILGTLPPGLTVDYYATANDAQLEINQLPNLYTNTTPFVQTIFIRVENANDCFGIANMDIVVDPLPQNNAVNNLIICSDDINSPAIDLTQFDASVLGTQNPTDFNITYHETQVNADNGTDILTSPYNNTNNPQLLYVRVENNVTGCFISSINFSFTVNVNPILVDPTPLEVCDDGAPDGITSINLAIKNGEITGSNPNYSLSYHLTQTDADNNIDPLSIPYTNTVNGQIIFVRVQDINTGCYSSTSLELIVQQAPIANIPTPLEYCDPDSDGFGEFDLESKNNEITGGDPSLTVTYHETLADANNNVNPLISVYNNIVVNQQTVFVHVESSTIATNCATLVELILIVNPTPQLGSGPSALEVCDDLSADGIAQFDLTSKNDEILQNLADPTLYTVSFYADEVNAELATNPIANPTNYTNTIAFNQELWVRLEDNATGCFKLTTLELVVNALPVLVQPAPLELCDDNNPGDEMEAFMLEDATDEILNGQTGISLAYYETQADADVAMNSISSPYTNITNPQTIFVVATNDVTGCSVSTAATILLRVNPIPSPTAPTDLEVCDEDNDGFAIFDLEERTLEIIGGELNTTVTYHETLEDANMGDNPLASPYTNIVINQQTIYIRLTNTMTGCYNASETLAIRVLASPEVPVTIDDYVICDTNSDGIAQFDLTTKDAEIIGTQTDVTLTYYITALDAESGVNPIANVGNYTNISNPQTIYVRLVSNTNACLDNGQFEIHVELPPVAVQPTPLQLCDDAIADEITVFDLTVKDNEITAGEASWSVSYYENQADADAQDNAVDADAYTNTSINGAPANPQTLYVVVTDTDTGCTDQVTLTIRVLPNPTPTVVIPDLILCDDINPGDMEEVFDLTTDEVLLLNGEVNVTPTYHETLEDAEDGVNAIPDPTLYTNTSTPQVIYVRVTNDITGCYTIVNFTIIVNPLPDVIAVTDFIACELFNDGFYDFDLTSKDEEILNGQDPTLFTVTYHATQADADDLMNALVSPYTNVTNPQQIFIAITNNDTGCSISTPSFNIEVQESAEANSDMEAILYEICDDEMDTDNDPTNNSAQFDLATQNDQLLDGQDPVNYIVIYYANEADAELGVNPLPLLYENLVNPQVIWARVDNDTPDVAGMDTSICYAVAPLTLQVNPLPVFDLEDSYILCVGLNGTEVLNPLVLDTGLSTPTYIFEWLLNGAVIADATEGNYMPIEGGQYTVNVIDATSSPNTMCEASDTTEVIESAPPTVIATVTTDAFSDTHVIEVTADGLGEYEYSLDNGAWQDENIFVDVSLGEHVVTARDKKGCGEASDTVTVMDYPKFFTPNGDGYNDTWNISAIGNQPNAKIYIFDRYGKLLKQLSPTGVGWNGTYNGNQLPTSDYWFVVEYNEPLTGDRKELKAHFTLKR